MWPYPQETAGGKINHLREIFSPIDILCVDETKIDSGYPDAQFSN